MRSFLRMGAVAAAAAALTACASTAPGRAPGVVSSQAGPVADPAPIVSGTMRPYEIRGRRHVPREQPDYDEVGLASWYGDAFHGRPTATGERFDMHALSAAHKTLPLPGLVEVTNLANGRRAVLRLNDRGPFVEGRIIDLSRAAADELGLLSAGVGRVRVRYVGLAPRLGGGRPLQQAAASPPTPSREPEREPARFWVQAGPFADAHVAQRTASALGSNARVEGTDAAPGGFRVMLGPWPDANAAERARMAVVAFGYGDALLISTP